MEYGNIPSSKENNRLHKKHSILGSISFLIAFVVIFFCVALFLFTGWCIELWGGYPIDDYYINSFLGIAFIFAIIFMIIGIILGIAGFVQRNRNKLFPILGTALNILTLVLFLVIYWIDNNL